MTDTRQQRLGALAAIVSEKQRLGRTVIMKLIYFLQEIRGIDLGYSFSLYTYGPFDSDVLEDLSLASSLGLVKSSVVTYPSGYGYDIEPGENKEDMQSLATEFTTEYEEDFRWTLDNFGARGAAGLELDSTIAYVDREASEAGENLTEQETVARVRRIKPRFESDEIAGRVDILRTLKVLHATT